MTDQITADDLAKIRQWCIDTFGPHERRGPLGPLAHLKKELKEIEDDPYDLEEWIDGILLCIDGAHRSGASPHDVIDALFAKVEKNMARVWPDWRGFSDSEAIEHDRTHD